MSRRVVLGVCCWAVLTVAALAGPAPQVVKVRLADGTTLEGTLVSEDDQQITVALALAGGTILQTRTFRKADLAGLTRLSPAEVAAQAMERAYAELQRYRLNPSTSYASSYYQQVIRNVFRPFLERYPDSPHAAAVAEQLSQWEAESRIVAGGQIKYDGQWLPAAAAKKLFEQEHGEEVRRRVRALLSQDRFPEALQLLRTLPAEAAHGLVEQTYRQWQAALEQERHRLNDDLQKYQTQLARARDQIARTQTTVRSAPRLGEPSGRSLDNPSAAFVYTRAVEQQRSASNQIARTQQRLTTVEAALAEIPRRASREGVSLATPPGTTAAAASPSAPAARTAEDQYSSPPLLRQILGFFRQYWKLLALGALLGVWILTRLLAR